MTTRRKNGAATASESLASAQAVTLSQEDVYLANCSKYGVEVDPAILISLRTRWYFMETNRRTSDGCMLPLMGILDDNTDVTHFKLNSRSSQGNANARALASIIQSNKTIVDLDVSSTGLTDAGIIELSEAICKNESITSLNLSSNSFTEVGAESLRKALLTNKAVKSLDLSCNALGFQIIDSLRCSCANKGMAVKTNGNFVFEEILNSVSHGVGFILSLIGAFVLTSEAVTKCRTDFHFWACVLYSVSLNLLFLFSSLFHSFFMMPKTSRVLQILDHVGIYLLIAGSYTPFLLISLHHVRGARLLLIAEWVAAFVGSVFAACADLNKQSTNVIELLFFLGMGFGVVLIWDSVVANLPAYGLYLLLGGGAAYVFGIIFFVLGEVHPIYHVIWHLFVVLGATLHWFGVYFFVVNKTIDFPAAIISSLGKVILD